MIDNETSTTNMCVPEPETSVYVVMLDKELLFYAPSHDQAMEQAHTYVTTVLLDGDYDSYIEVGDDIIQVIGKYRNFLVSYDRVLYTLEIVPVNKAKFIPVYKTD